MFGANLIMILVFQEKDQVHGEIYYSIIPLFLNNVYMLYSNFKQVVQIQYETNVGPKVNRTKVYYNVLWYIGSIIAYCYMEKFNQGLMLKTSEEMFLFSICETFFMVAMAMSNFYSWQTYSGGYDPNSNEEQELIPVGFRQVYAESLIEFQTRWKSMCGSNLCVKLQTICDPIFLKLEQFTGRGGIIGSMNRKFNYDDDEQMVP